MDTPLSKTMKEKLDAVHSGSAVNSTYCNESNTWNEEILKINISPDDKLLTQQCSIFSGIKVSYNYFLADSFSHEHAHMPTIMEVNHCRNGRMGWKMEHNMNLYLGEGDLSIHMKDNCAISYLSLPLGNYEGISFSIDFDLLEKNPPEILKDANIDYKHLKAVFCDSTKIIALQKNNDIDSIFQGLYDLPTNLVIPYCKIKTQEFILYLSRLSLQELPSLHPCDTEQVKIVKEIHSFLTTNLEKRYTIEYLSKKYLMNTSSLKSSFKAVYGVPIATYMKQYRMNQAITYLRETNCSMAEIATAIGYENQSKFSAAFKNVIGISPNTYRKNLFK